MYDKAAGSCAFYVNGVQQGSTQTGLKTSVNAGSSTVALGTYNVDNSGAGGTQSETLNGYMSCVSIFSDKRTQAEIQADMFRDWQGNEDNLQACWLLNNDYLDLTSNNNDLTAAASTKAPSFVSYWAYSPLGSSSWSTRRGLYIPSSKVSGSADLSGFIVNIKDSMIPDAIYSAAQSDGKDIRFSSDTSGVNQLPFHIVSLDTTAKTCDIKVLTQLEYDVNTKIYVWAGYSSAVAYPATAYLGQYSVYDDDISCFYPLQTDATDISRNANNLVVTGTPTFGAAQFGKGVTIDSSSKNINQTSGLVNLPTGTGDFVIEALIKRTGTLPASGSGYMVAGVRTDGNNQTAISPGSSDNNVRCSMFSGGVGSFSTQVSLTTDTWEAVAFVRSNSGATVKVFKNGTLVATDTITARNHGSAVGARIGESYSTWNCAFDEVVIRKATKSDDYMITRQRMLSDPSTFVLQLAEENSGLFYAQV